MLGGGSDRPEGGTNAGGGKEHGRPSVICVALLAHHGGLAWGIPEEQSEEVSWRLAAGDGGG